MRTEPTKEELHRTAVKKRETIKEQMNIKIENRLMKVVEKYDLKSKNAIVGKCRAGTHSAKNRILDELIGAEKIVKDEQTGIFGVLE